MFFPDMQSHIFPCKIFFHSKSVCRIFFFLKSPIPFFSKVKWSALDTLRLRYKFPATVHRLTLIFAPLSANFYLILA